MDRYSDLTFFVFLLTLSVFLGSVLMALTELWKDKDNELFRLFSSSGFPILLTKKVRNKMPHDLFIIYRRMLRWIGVALVSAVLFFLQMYYYEGVDVLPSPEHIRQALEKT